MKRLFVISIFLLASVVAQATELKPVADDFVTPGLKLSDLQGQAHDLADYKGKVVLLQYWATYCTPAERKCLP